MHRCYVKPEILTADTIDLDRDNAHHLLQVLRIREGEKVELFDGIGNTRAARVAAAQRRDVVLQPCAAPISHPPPTCRLTLAQCIIKGNRMDWIIEKAVELGAWAILPVISDRTIVRLNPGQAKEKIQRWQRIADGATRQCGSAWLTRLLPPVTIKALAPPESHHTSLIAALTDNTNPLREVITEPAPQSATVLVGPEGDFTPAELKTAQSLGYLPVSLGPRVLRAETAGLYALSAINCAWM